MILSYSDMSVESSCTENIHAWPMDMYSPYANQKSHMKCSTASMLCCSSLLSVNALPLGINCSLPPYGLLIKVYVALPGQTYGWFRAVVGRHWLHNAWTMLWKEKYRYQAVVWKRLSLGHDLSTLKAQSNGPYQRICAIHGSSLGLTNG